MRFRVEAELSAIVVPALMPCAREDHLWHHTCFEAFLSEQPGRNYLELNFSPSSRWAAYRFASYRLEIAEAAINVPDISTASSANAFELHATIDSPGFFALLDPDVVWYLGPAAVIEETDGTKSYWALRHPPGPPDFHHPDCFAATLGPPERA